MMFASGGETLCTVIADALVRSHNESDELVGHLETGNILESLQSIAQSTYRRLCTCDLYERKTNAL